MSIYYFEITELLFLIFIQTIKIAIFHFSTDSKNNLNPLSGTSSLRNKFTVHGCNNDESVFPSPK